MQLDRLHGASHGLAPCSNLFFYGTEAMSKGVIFVTIAPANQLCLPDGPAAVTPDWLTTVLRRCGAINQAAVQAIELELFDEAQKGVTSEIVRFRLTYDRADENGPATLFGKFSHADPAVRAAIHELGSYQREIGFYQDLADGNNLPAPTCYYSAIDPTTGASALLLEDLAHLRMTNFAAGCNQQEAELVIHHLTQLHASAWGNPRLQRMTWLRSFDQDAEVKQAKFQSWWAVTPQKYTESLPGHQLPATFIALGDRFGQQAARIFTQLAEPPLTCVHADPHVLNLLFGTQPGDPPLKLIDWQAIRLGRGMIDVAYFMITSIPVEQRRQTERPLVQNYYERLHMQGIEGYSFEQCCTDYRRAAFWSLSVIASVTALLDMTTTDRQALLQTWFQRMVAFSEDHALAEML